MAFTESTGRDVVPKGFAVFLSQIRVPQFETVQFTRSRRSGRVAIVATSVDGMFGHTELGCGQSGLLLPPGAYGSG